MDIKEENRSQYMRDKNKFKTEKKRKLKGNLSFESRTPREIYQSFETRRQVELSPNNSRVSMLANLGNSSKAQDLDLPNLNKRILEKKSINEEIKKRKNAVLSFKPQPVNSTEQPSYVILLSS